MGHTIFLNIKYYKPMKQLFLACITLITITMTAQQMNNPTVDVTGEGIVTIVPDAVTIKVRVENTGSEVKPLKQLNDGIVSDVLATAKRMGIEAKHITTDYVRLNKTYEYNTKKYSYKANQAISIKVTDLANYEGLMDALLESGINRIDGVHFSSSSMDALLEQARTKAILNAKKKALGYAAALGQKVGKAVYIGEFTKQTGQPKLMNRMATMMELDASGGGQTLAPGEMEIRTTVHVSFMLD